MVIAHNIAALNAYKSLGVGTGKANKSMEKLSSGYRINRAGDDAAGLSISEKMRSQIRGLNQASRNAQDGISMIQTAEGALNEEHSILQRMRELAVQSATDTNADEDRTSIQSELEQLTNEINRIGNTTEFNGMKILNGDKATTLVGAKQSEDTKVGLKIKSGEIGDDFDGYKVKIVKDGSDDDKLESAYSAKTITITAGANKLKDDVLTADKVQELIRNATGGDDTLKKFTVTGSTTSIADATTWTLADGADGTTDDKSVYFHVGANQDQVINASFNDMRASKLGITLDATSYAEASAEEKEAYTSGNTVNNGTSITAEERALNISTREGANTAISKIDAAIKIVSNERSKYGAVQNRLEYTINNLNTSAENMQSAESRVRDVDMASEMMEMTKNNILQQAAQSMLIQANQRPQQALQLLQ